MQILEILKSHLATHGDLYHKYLINIPQTGR